MITLRTGDVVVDGNRIQALKEEFQRCHCVLLRGLLDGAVLDLLRPRIELQEWVDRDHDGIGKEKILDDPYALNLLHFAINAPKFLETVISISGCDQVTWFDGRIYRMEPRADHYDSWHDDVHGSRLVGMSINLSFARYEGGEFEIRKRGASDSTCIANKTVGDATLFRIQSGIQHQVKPVNGTAARTAFAGWFKSGKPDLLDRLRAAHAGSPGANGR